MSDQYLQGMVRARDRRAVLKMELAKLRSAVQGCLIIALEGKDDKSIYAQWIRRIDPEIKYEPFACGGKRKVLELKAAVEADLNNLADDLLFVIDRDFDDTQGTLSSDSLFMTDSYSVENYLVESGVLQELLTNELGCDAQPGLRRDIQASFGQLYDDFLKCMCEVNRRIFFARRLQIDIVGSIPKKISEFVTINISSIVATGMTPAEFIKLEREPTAEEIALHNEDFEGMEAKSRHRGKFAFVFLMKWLELLADDRKAENSHWFPNLNKNIKINLQAISPGLMATKSSIPKGLPEFIKRAS
jgi:hypothetical protein